MLITALCAYSTRQPEKAAVLLKLLIMVPCSNITLSQWLSLTGYHHLELCRISHNSR